MTTQSRQPHTTNHVFTPSASAAGPATKRPIGEAIAEMLERAWSSVLMRTMSRSGTSSGMSAMSEVP
mgnify:CR=1 FL=1